MLSLMYTSLPFQSTLPVWGGTQAPKRPLHLPPKFQSTLPVWGGTRQVGPGGQKYRFQSTLPVWGGTPAILLCNLVLQISIHPPRVGRDPGRLRMVSVKNISIHPPRVGRDLWKGGPMIGCCYFNPPSPCGEGRGQKCRKRCKNGNFNPPSPCGEGQGCLQYHY